MFATVFGVIVVATAVAIAKGRRKGQQNLVVVAGTAIWFVAVIIVWEMSGGATQLEGTVTGATPEGPSDLLVYVRIDNHTDDPVTGECLVRAYDPFETQVGSSILVSDSEIPPGESHTAGGAISISTGPVSEVVVEGCRAR